MGLNNLVPLVYDEKAFFEKMYILGYNRFSYGRGKWTKREKISFILAFYHPSGLVYSYERPVFKLKGKVIFGEKFSEEYSSGEFKRHRKKYRIKMKKKRSLAEIVKRLWK